MAKLTVTYTLEVDEGAIPAEALAEYLLRAERENSDFNVFEIGCNNGSIEIEDVQPAA